MMGSAEGVTTPLAANEPLIWPELDADIDDGTAPHSADIFRVVPTPQTNRNNLTALSDIYYVREHGCDLCTGLTLFGSSTLLHTRTGSLCTDLTVAPSCPETLISSFELKGPWKPRG